MRKKLTTTQIKRTALRLRDLREKELEKEVEHRKDDQMLLHQVRQEVLDGRVNEYGNLVED